MHGKGRLYLKIKITYTAPEKALFERTRAELLQTVPDARQHQTTAPGGVTVWYMTTCKKPRSVVK